MGSTGGGRLDVTTMGDLVGACVGVGTPGISKPDADIALKRHGLRVLEGRLLVGSKSGPVRRILGPPRGRRVLRDHLPRPRREEGRSNAVQSRLQGQVRVRAGLPADGRRLMRGSHGAITGLLVQPVQATRAGMPDVPVYARTVRMCTRARASTRALAILHVFFWPVPDSTGYQAAWNARFPVIWRNLLSARTRHRERRLAGTGPFRGEPFDFVSGPAARTGRLSSTRTRCGSVHGFGCARPLA